MKNPIQNPLRFLLAAALVALPLASSAEECCAAAKDGKAVAASTCCAAGAQSVTLKFKSGDADLLKAKLSKLAGVTSVDTCSESKFTKVGFSKDKACSDSIMAAIKKAGLQVEARRLTLAVDGMACGACSDKITKALSKVKGVSVNQVCQESKTATVDFNPRRVSTEKVLAAIQAAGFKATEAMN